ncbi:MAG: tetratricopeptide repeat protein [Erythrobacter sp.]|jgi:Flp pilus assembly protein TadD|nr:tetratricopeptide repeat protein [Erythrobacter sp.]
MIATYLLALMLQVGPNPQGEDGLRLPEELRNRPERPVDPEDPLQLNDPDARWLAGCLTQIESDPARAHSQAQIKRAEALGDALLAANHCLGLAATELGLWDDARQAFLAVRDRAPTSDLRSRARFGAMAGNAALAGGDPAGALALLEVARADAGAAASNPLQVIAALDTARALVALGRDAEALAPLDAATTLAPQESEGWLLKATLLRRLGRLEDAQAAIEEAAALAPQEGDIGLEAGVIAVLSGREEAARASWQSVIDVQPDSLAAKTARGYLAQLTGEPEQETP